MAKHEMHGMRWTRGYHIWLSMKDRCLNQKSANYHNYGGRGIAVCERWRNSFSAFHADMGDAPNGRSLERVNNDGPYSPDNCIWAVKKVQANNTRGNRRITLGGKTKTLAQWSEDSGIDRFAIADRLNRGWKVSDAIRIPVRHCPRRMLTLNGETMCLSDWARRLGIRVGNLHARIENGWPVEKALSCKSGFNLITHNGATKTVSEWSRETGVNRATIRRRLSRGFSVADALNKHFHAPKTTKL